MDKSSAEVRYNQWKQIILEANNAPVSKKVWCRENGISDKQLYYWQRKIRLREAAALPVPAPGRAAPTMAESSGEFVELSFSGSGQAQAPVLPGCPGGVPAVLIEAGCFRVYVGDGVREDTLRTVLMVARDA